MITEDPARMEFLPYSKANSENEPDVAGPFEFPLRFSGFDWRSNATSNNAIKTVRILMSVLVCFIFFLAIVLPGSEEQHPFTVKWADQNLSMVMCAYAFACAICLMAWTKNGFIVAFETELARMKTFRRQANELLDNYKKQKIGCIVFSVILLISWMISAFKGILYQAIKSDHNATEYSEFHIARDNLFGAQPVVYIYMGLVSCIATCIYWLAHEHLRREFEYFNEELKNASETQDFTNTETFVQFGTRHRGLMNLLTLMNFHLGKMAMINGFTAGTAMCFSIYITMGFMKHLNPAYIVLLCIWNLIVAHSLTVVVGEPGKIQKQVHLTKKILLEDADLPNTVEQKSLSCYRLFIDRCDNSSKMFLLSAVPVHRKTAHWVIFLVPNIASLLAICAKLAGVIQV